MFGNTHGISENVFANSHAFSSALCSKTLNLCDDTAAERSPMQESTVTPVAGVGDQERHNSYPEIPTKFVGQKFVLPVGGKKFLEL